MSNNAVKYDRAMAASEKNSENILYISYDQSPLRVSGFPFAVPGEKLRRLPDDPRLTDAVRSLSEHTSGGRIDFRSNTKKLNIRVKLRNSSHMFHMPDVGAAGFDLYMGEPGKSVMVGTSRTLAGSDEYESTLHTVDLPGTMADYTINMPLYSGIESLEIGIDPDAELAPPAPWNSEKPLVFYGTSITQGGCASRPGMSYTNILGRRFNMPSYNFGFSGNGKGEPEVAEYLAKINNPACYVLDYEANALPEGIRDTLSSFIDILRASHPETPILVISCLRFNREILLTGSPEIQVKYLAESAKFQRAEVNRRRRNGDKNIYFVNGAALTGKDWHEFSVDGCHQTDLGFYFFANSLQKILAKIL